VQRSKLAAPEHIQFLWKLNMLQLLAFVAFSDGKPVSTFPENALVGQFITFDHVSLSAVRHQPIDGRWTAPSGATRHADFAAARSSARPWDVPASEM
jgi:hypothetical protein